QKLVAHRLEIGLDLLAVAAVEFEVEHLALADMPDAVDSEACKSAFDCLALRVQNAVLQCNRHAFLDHYLPLCLLYQNRSGATDRFILVDDAKPAGNLGIGFQEATHVAAKAVLVHLLMGFDVPETAAVRRYLVGQDDPHHVAFVEPAAFDLEVDKLDADAEEKAAQEVVDADGERHDVVKLSRIGPAEGGNMLFRHHRIGKRIGLVIEFDDRAGQDRAFLDAETCRQRARCYIPDDDLERNDLHFLDQLLT